MLDIVIDIVIAIWVLGLMVTIPFSRKGYKRDFRWANGNQRKTIGYRIGWTIVAVLWPLALAAVILASVIELWNRKT